jgi:hypothetical protein
MLSKLGLMSSNSKKKSGLWAFLTQSARYPTSYDVFMSIARADILIEKVRAIYRQQENFDKQTKEIERLRRTMTHSHPDSPEYVYAKAKLYKILKL